MSEFCVEHPRGRHGGVSYAPEDLGLDTAEVANRFRDYRDRFVS